MLSVKSLEHRYDEDTKISFPDFSCEKGGRLLILGQSGCGKTTLLNLMGGMLLVQQGEIYIADEPIHAMSQQKLDRFRGKNIGFVFQKPHFIQALSVFENVCLASSLSGIPQDKLRVKNLLDKLGIGHKANKLPGALSAGEQQRVSIARALINKPALLLADEPTSALDDYHCEQVIHLLQQTAEEDRATLLVVTHDHRIKSVFSNTITLQA